MAKVSDIDFQRRVDLAQTVLQVLDDWGLVPEHQIALLDLPADTRPRALKQYRCGTPLPDSEALMVRVHYLLGIQRALSNLFPHNVHMGRLWVTTPNRFFGGHTPLEHMLDHGPQGMRTVLDHLYGSGPWGSTPI